MLILLIACKLIELYR